MAQLLRRRLFGSNSRAKRIQLVDHFDGLFGANNVAQGQTALGHTDVGLLEARIDAYGVSGVGQGAIIVEQHHVAGGPIAIVCRRVRTQRYGIRVELECILIVLRLVLVVAQFLLLLGNAASRESERCGGEKQFSWSILGGA